MSVCTLTNLNPGFGGPWKNLWIFYVHIWHFHNASKEVFWPKKIWISCTGSKVPFWQNGKIAKMALLNPCMIFFFFQKTSFEALWKCHIQKVFITFSRVRQIQDLGQSKYKLRLFSKGFWKFFLFRVPMKPLQAWSLEFQIWPRIPLKLVIFPLWKNYEI